MSSRGSAIQVVQSIANRDLVSNQAVERDYKKYLAGLVDLGLVRKGLVQGRTTYEITETGYRFLEECDTIDRDLGLGLDGLAKEEITVIIPTMNEAENIGEIVSSIPFGWEVILVDFSTDGTAEKAMSLRSNVRILRRGPGEVGKGAALRLGLREARGTIVVTMDGDGSHRTSELVRLVSTLVAHSADMVQASRMLQANGSEEMGPHEHTIRYFGNKIVTFLINVLFHSSSTDSQYGFRAIRKDFISKLSLRSDDWSIETEIAARAAKCHGKILEVPSVELERKHGESRLNLLEYIAVMARRLPCEIFRR